MLSVSAIVRVSVEERLCALGELPRSEQQPGLFRPLRRRVLVVHCRLSGQGDSGYQISIWYPTAANKPIPQNA